MKMHGGCIRYMDFDAADPRFRGPSQLCGRRRANSASVEGILVVSPAVTCKQYMMADTLERRDVASTMVWEL
jgi:hypothetical protein